MTNPNMLFEGMPVREAKRALRICPIEADKKRAKRGDPSCCVAANTIKRTQAVEEVRVYRSRSLLRPTGKNYWVRYQTPKSLSEETRVFDRGGEFEGKEFLLQPLAKSSTREYRAKADEKSGRMAPTGPKKAKRKRHLSVMTKLRGSPHFQHHSAN